MVEEEGEKGGGGEWRGPPLLLRQEVNLFLLPTSLSLSLSSLSSPYVTDAWHMKNRGTGKKLEMETKGI